MTPGNSNGKRRSSVSNASGVFEKLKTNVFKAFDDVDMDTFFEVSTVITVAQLFTLARIKLLCMKNAGTQWAMDYS